MGALTPSLLSNDGQILIVAIEHNKVIACPMHFGKAQCAFQVSTQAVFRSG